MRRLRFWRSGWVTALLLLFAAVAWLLLAPGRLGGSTEYVTTHGDSMAPRFESGDLALIRPADRYRVGEIVAYRSKLLDTVVLHRIIGREGDRYVFKGDNNDFVDPTRPRASELVGKLWLRVPNGGVLMASLSSPLGALALTACALLILLVGTRREGGTATPKFDGRTAVTACVLVALGCAGVAVLAFARPATKPVPAKTSYAEKVEFAYSAHAVKAAAPVYRGGIVRTGDPIFLRLVDRIHVKVGYRFVAAGPQAVGGAYDVALRLTGPTGWSRTLRLAPRRPIREGRADTRVTLDLAHIQRLIRRVETLTGAGTGGAYTVDVVPRLHAAGTLHGRPVASDFRPALSFQLDSLQLRPGDLASSRRGSVTVSATASNTLGVAGHELPVRTVRAIALAGLLLAAAIALLVALRESRRPSGPAAQIERRYRDLIVPIAETAHNPARPPIDVTSIDVLAKLAERSERLILHHHSADVDTYLVDDEGTLYRYNARPLVA